jgi:hypothetical protein
MPSEAAILAKARERERRFVADIKAHPGLPSRFDDFLIYVEDNLLDIRELAAVRGLDFKERADRYIAHVVETWRNTLRDGETAAAQLEQTLRALLATL